MPWIDAAVPDISPAKTNKYPLAGGEDPNKWVQASQDWNKLRTGALDIRAWIRGELLNWFGFGDQAGDPVPAGIASYLYTTAANLHFKQGATARTVYDDLGEFSLPLGAGSAAAVSGAGLAKIKYNEVANQIQASLNGAAYTALGVTYTGSLGVSLVGADFRLDTTYSPTLTGTWTFNNAGIAFTGTAALTSSGVVLITADRVRANRLAFVGQVIGDLSQADSVDTFARLPAVAVGNALISGGVGAVSSWGKIGLTTHVSGVLPVANGGTGLSALGLGLQVLRTNAGATAMEWATIAGGGTVTSVTANADGTITITGTAADPIVGVSLGAAFNWTNTHDFAAAVTYVRTLSLGAGGDCFVARAAAAIMQMGADSATPIAQTIRAAGGSGTDIAGADFNTVAGIGTGTASSGNLKFGLSLRTSTTGTTPNTVVYPWVMTAPSDTGDGTGVTHSNLIPAVNNVNDLGTTALRLKDGWFAGAVEVGSLTIGGAALNVGRQGHGADFATAADITLTGTAKFYVGTGTTTVKRIAKAGFNDGDELILFFSDVLGCTVESSVASDATYSKINMFSGSQVCKAVALIYNAATDLFEQSAYHRPV